MVKAILRTLVGVGMLVGCIIVSAAVVRTDGSSPDYYADVSGRHHDADNKGRNYVPPIDPSRVDCTAFTSGSYQSCYKTQ
jgi:hypothetical protein